jgi:hypothetical protein
MQHSSTSIANWGCVISWVFMLTRNPAKAFTPSWVIGRYQVAYRMVQRQAANLPPNLLVVFNDLMLNLQADGTPKSDQRPRYVGFNIPVINPETSERESELQWRPAPESRSLR